MERYSVMAQELLSSDQLQCGSNKQVEHLSSDSVQNFGLSRRRAECAAMLNLVPMELSPMALTHDRRREPPHLLLVEPNQPDAHWFEIMLGETGLPRATFYYSTGIAALAAYRAGNLAPIDAVIVAERLPMLTIEEFVDGVRTLDPFVPIVVLGESLQPFSSSPDSCRRFAKPLSNKDLQAFWHLIRRRYYQRQQKRVA